MSTSTATLTESSSSRLLSSSTSSLSNSQAQPNVVRIYKQASQLFVTRRVQEALETLEPLLQPNPSPPVDETDTANGESHAQEPSPAPIATASRGARVKIWSLWISILNEIVAMGQDEGKQAFGLAKYRQMVAQVRDGSVWQEIVDTGYGGIEGSVDAEVVANLATLMLAHAPSQKVTQQRLETYLAASSAPPLDVEGHMQRRKVPNQAQANGTSTPRDLNSRLKILEIFTLHVLPRNQEWQYAREFISMSEVLDEDRREAFLQALQNIQDEKDFDSKREEELQRQRKQQLEDAKRRDEEERRAQQLEQEQKRKKQQDNTRTTENDYGVDHSSIGGVSHLPPKPISSGTASASNPRSAAKQSSGHRTRPSGSSRNAKPLPPPTLTRRAGMLIGGLQRAIIAMGQNMRSHPMLLLRVVAFILAFIMALARQDVRDRLTRVRDASWEKVKRTIGMGVKVSYI